LDETALWVVSDVAEAAFQLSGKRNGVRRGLLRAVDDGAVERSDCRLGVTLVVLKGEAVNLWDADQEEDDTYRREAQALRREEGPHCDAP